MPIEIVGLVHHNTGSMLDPQPLSVFDPDAIVGAARLQEEVGFDRVLIANSVVMPDSLSIATHVAAHTTKLKMMIAQRPGFIAPTIAGRMLATIDQLSRGRASVHIIAGANDAELKADGDFLTKEERYARCREYVQILRQVWNSSAAFTFNGTYYTVENAFAPVKPFNGHSIPVFWGGSSDTAVDIGVQSADTYALTGDTLAGTAEMVGKVRAAAARHGRTPDILMTMVLVLGATEEEAWRKADQILERVVANVEKRKREQQTKTPNAFGDGKPVAVTFQRLLENAQQGTRLDKCFWTAITKATNAQQGNASTLVGTPAQLADALMDYYDLGVTRFLLRGYYPREDARLIGEQLIPLLRDAAARRDALKLSA
jgi:alkanesulfonate monooxygenase